LTISRENSRFSMMSLRKSILSRLSGFPFKSGFVVCIYRLFFWFAILFAAPIPAPAKTAPAATIVLFDGPTGAAYVQITGMTLNGKTELRICDGVPKFDKGAYDNLPRTQLAGATSLERSAGGVLTLTVEGKPLCVVPANLKFDTRNELTPAQAADQAVLQGTPVSSSASEFALPEFKPGVRLVFVPAPDADLAEFLRTQRANSAVEWQEFLRRYPSSPHAGDARNALAEVHQHAAEAAFARHQQLVAAHQPDIALLKQARTQAQAADRVAPGYRPALTLVETISRELDTLLEQDRAGLQMYRRALENHGAGYSRLVAARAHVEELLEVSPDCAPAMTLRREILSEEQKLEATLAHVESLLASKRYDEAVASLEPYGSFAGEVPRLEAALAVAYGYHLNQGRELSGRQDWEQAAVEFRKALAVRGDSREAATSLNQAETQLAAAHNQRAANLAALQSSEFANKGDYIEAYNTLAQLPDAQRALVATQLSALISNYVAAASRRAQKLQEIHLPIRGRADEDAVRQACELFDHASSLAGDPAMKLKRDFLFGKLSAFYLEQARKHLGKPSGAGVGIGWLYLKEAQRYDANVGIVKDQVKDLTATYASVYQQRAQLSVGILIRDQTSRENGPGFSDQMADAMAHALETVGIQVEIARKPAEAVDAMQPNFLLVGDILEHRVVKNTGLETLQSKYRAGTHEVKNPVWLQADKEYQAAQQQLAAAQRSFDDARTQRKKKEMIAAASDAVQQAQQHADELRHTVETTNQTRVEEIVSPYSYTKRTIDLTASIDLSFRITDRSGAVIEPAVNLHKGNHKSASVLENVKPEDAEGVTNKAVEPDETQFLTDLEIEARDALVKAVREKAASLPAKILREARKRAQRSDADGAGEEYVLYLNATPGTASAERDEAAKFLRDQFNLAPPTPFTW
jgi:hypothetical protein